jgi:hypothetical protein
VSEHSYSRCWIHLVWATYKRTKYFGDSAGSQLAQHLKEYSESNQIYLPIVFANPDSSERAEETRGPFLSRFSALWLTPPLGYNQLAHVSVAFKQFLIKARFSGLNGLPPACMIAFHGFCVLAVIIIFSLVLSLL